MLMASQIHFQEMFLPHIFILSNFSSNPMVILTSTHMELLLLNCKLHVHVHM